MISMLDFLSLDLFDNVAIFIVVVMFFFCFCLFVKNRHLEDEIENLKFEDRVILKKNNYINNKNEDIVSMAEISRVDVDAKIVNKDVEIDFNNKNDEDNKGSIDMKKRTVDNINKNRLKNIKLVNRNYNDFTKNTSNFKQSVDSNSNYSQDENKFNDIDKASVKLPQNDNVFDFEEFIPDGNVDLENDKRNATNTNSNIGYLNDVSQKLAKEITPSTIELTDYEQEQEDNAIISYKELLKAHEKNSDDMYDEDFDFIEELKEFRDSLN